MNPVRPLTILLADDEAVLLRAIRVALELRGYQVTPAGDGAAAKRLLEEGGDTTYDALVTDIDMPGCSGVELASAARTRFPGLKIVFTSGQPQPALAAAVKGDPGARFMQKPFSGSELIRCLTELCAAGAGGGES